MGDVPLIADASSDILCIQSVDKYALIYPAREEHGTERRRAVIMRDDLLKRIPDGLHDAHYPRMSNKSLYNTPNTWAFTSSAWFASGCGKGGLTSDASRE